MSATGTSPKPMSASAADAWHSLLRPEVELSAAYGKELSENLRAARLTFGDRIHCPFLRPFFLSEEDEQRVRAVAETIAALGERVAAQALESRELLAQVALSPEEEQLARIEPGYRTASTAARLDAFLLPDSLSFAEYNAESPAGPGYTETLAEMFSGLEVMGRFRQKFDARAYPLMGTLLKALLDSYREWGGTAAKPVIAIVDWREVPTWNEFEILQARFEKLGVPTIVCEPRELVFDGQNLTAQGKKIDLVYRRVLINDIIARPAECEALVRAYEARAVCVTNTLRCKIPHKKAFFAVLTDERNCGLFSATEQEIIRQHIPWTRLVADAKTERDGKPVELLKHVRRNRTEFVMKPNDEYGGAGVTLGWEASEKQWDEAVGRALADRHGAWVVQARIPVRREVFPHFGAGAAATMRDMLVDLAPYLFRGRMAGFLTRLSATGLANVTSGGGQVPAFVVRPVA